MSFLNWTLLMCLSIHGGLILVQLLIFSTHWKGSQLGERLGLRRSSIWGPEKNIQVELLGTFKLVLDSCHVLDLDETFYVPSWRRNLISISRLLSFGYDVIFRDSGCDVKSMVNLLVLVCRLMVYSDWHWMHHIRSFYQMSVPPMMFCLLLQNALRFPCNPLCYGIVLGISLKRNYILLWRKVFLALWIFLISPHVLIVFEGN